MNNAVKTYLKGVDWALITQVFTLSLIGIIVVISATSHNSEISQLWKKQFFWFCLSLLGMFVFSRIDYRFWIEASYIFYWIAILSLLLVLVIGDETNGAKRWIKLGILSYQPSELAKLSILLVLARYIGSRTVELFFVGRLLFILAMLGFPLVLILKQPDLGSALLLVPVSVMLMYVGGIQLKWLLTMFLMALSSLPLVWHFLKDYQKERLFVFINPQDDPLGAGYNIIQSMIAIGSGGITGKGYMQGTQTQLSFIPEHHTDFIFSVLGEEWGFLGCALVLILYYFMIQKTFQIARKARDREGSLLALGIAGMFTVQVVINVGMTVGLLPVTGLTLPFISYGGSSLAFSYVAVGMLLNISYANRRPVLVSGRN
ncbi:MAG TPA: rod shape-determining protein RodA [bacterium]|nr:rod shape-determining protein RodA [bacterium]